METSTVERYGKQNKAPAVRITSHHFSRARPARTRDGETKIGARSISESGRLIHVMFLAMRNMHHLGAEECRSSGIPTESLRVRKCSSAQVSPILINLWYILSSCSQPFPCPSPAPGVSCSESSRAPSARHATHLDLRQPDQLSQGELVSLPYLQ